MFPVTHNMHSDESVYPDYDTFNPDRYRDDKSTMTEGHYTFGFGRRCVVFLPFSFPFLSFSYFNTFSPLYLNSSFL